MNHCKICGQEIKTTAHTCNMSKDQFQGSWHGGQHTSGYIAPIQPTIRDLFAMAAMQARITTDGYMDSSIPEYSYKMADAMLKERNK